MDLIPVKKSTLATWCREVKLTEEQFQAIRERTGSREGIPRDTNRKRLEEIEQIVLREILCANSRRRLILGCRHCSLLGGGRKDSQSSRVEQHGSTSTSPVHRMDETLRRSQCRSLQLHLHEGNDDESAKRHWVEQTGLVDANFHRRFIKPKGTGHRKNHLESGLCTVRMRRAADAWNVVMAWIDVMTEQFGLKDLHK
jgi:hypothetical protein